MAWSQMGADLTNGDLENWIDSPFYSFPEGFRSHSEWSVFVNMPENTLKDFTNPFSSLFCAEMETILGDYLGLGFAEYYVPGVVTNGKPFLPDSSIFVNGTSVQSINGGVAFTDRPDKFTGYWEYEPAAGGDSAWAYIKLWQNDGTIIAEDEVLADASTGGEYAKFEVDINYLTMDDPDSMLVIVSTSRWARAGNVGSTMFLDSLGLIYVEEPPSGISEHLGLAINVFPNPASSWIQMENPHHEAAMLSIYNSMGQRMMVQQLNARQNQAIDISGLNPGAYLFRLESEDLIVGDGLFHVQ
jgi:hypothetical protein